MTAHENELVKRPLFDEDALRCAWREAKAQMLEEFSRIIVRSIVTSLLIRRAGLAPMGYVGGGARSMRRRKKAHGRTVADRRKKGAAMKHSDGVMFSQGTPARGGIEGSSNPEFALVRAHSQGGCIG